MAKRTTCSECELEGKYKQNVGVYEDGLYCFRCEKMIKTEDTDMKQKEHFMVGALLPDGMPRRRLTKETVDAFNVTYNGNRVIFGYYSNKTLITQKIKDTEGNYKIINYSKDVDMFGSNLHDSSRKNIIITEGEEDAMAVYQSLGHGASRSLNHVTSLPRGAGSAAEFIKQHYQVLVQYDYITLCFDNDEAGQKALEKVIPLFSKNKIKIVKLPRKDACEMLINHQQEELKWAVLKADTITPKGIVRMSDLTDEFFDYEYPVGETLPFPKLNKGLGGLRKGELTMVCAGSGLGKSVFTTNIIYDLILNKGLKIVDIKLEEDKKKTIFTYAGMYFENKNYAMNPKALTHEQREEFREKFAKYMTHDHFGSLTSKELLDVLEYYALSEKVDFIFLDHISMAISGTISSKEGERKDIDILLTRIRELVNTTGVGVVCISHVSNPKNGGKEWEEGRRVNRSALRGSGSLVQLSDSIIGIEGDLTEEDTKNYRQIRLLKTRYGNEQEVLCDTFEYDGNTGKIHVITDEEPF